jgi:predicted DNA-binding transcriptional regulator AlpA
MTKADAREQLLTERDLADRWRCSKGWLANLRSAGEGPRYHKLNKLVRYRAGDVDAYEAMRVVKVRDAA